MKLLKSNNAAQIWIASLTVFSTVGLATNFEYFNKGIDFWNDKKEPPQSQPLPTEAVKANTELGKEAFSWGKYLDPKNQEFFKEGDYTPPEPFMEIVRNPTDDNLKMWFTYMDKKNELSSRLEARIREYADKKGMGIAQTEKDKLVTQAHAIAQVTPDTQRYRFRMYFDSKCPHCRHMFETLSDLQTKGFFVEARQIDDDPKGVIGLPFTTSHAGKDELKSKDVQSVPLLLIGDLKRKVVYRMSGYQSVDTVFGVLNQKKGDL